MAKDKPTGGKISLSGRLTIRTARDLKKKIADAYVKGGPLRLDIRDVEEVDLSFFQLLYSLQRTALRDKKQLVLEPPVSPLLRRTMSAIGFEQNESGSGEGDDPCIWRMISTDES
ncbi:MAG: STAS domain-containing protein [Spirochaetales bacterium]|nr:STAS domain-containing protein [Spirochaetales bacterium]